MQKSEQSNGWTEIHRLMRENGLSARELAQIAGVVPSAVQNWKNGKSINPNSLLNIARHFSVSVERLLTGEENTSLFDRTGKPASSDMESPLMVREARPPPYGATRPPGERAPALCRIPEDCDLPSKLATLETQMLEIRSILLSLLAEERRRDAPPHADPDAGSERAG